MSPILASFLPESSSATSPLLAVGAAAAITGILYFFSAQAKKKRDALRPWPQVKGAVPVLGHFLQVGGTAQLINKMQEWADDYSKESGMFECNLAGVSYLVVCREDRAKEVLLRRPIKVIRTRTIAEGAKSVGADGVFSAEGSQWKTDRRLMAPNFNKNHVQDYMTHIVTVVGRLVNKWSALGEGGSPVVINTDLISFSLDTTALVTLGKDFDTLRSSNSVDAKDLAVMFEGGFFRSLCPFPFWKIPFVGQYLDGVGWSRARVLSTLSKLVDNNLAAESSGDGTEVRDTFVRKAASQSLKDPTLTRERIVGNMLTVFIAGTDSTASTLSSVVQMLATDKTGLQDELVAEIATLGKDVEDLTVDDLQDGLPRLKSFLYEVHRWYAAFPTLFLETNEAIEMFGTTVPKGQQITIFSRYIAQNPYSPAKGVPVGPNGEGQLEFCPRRYILKEGNNLSVQHPEKNSTTFLIFGHGSRVCPGRGFSDAMVALVAVALLQNFRMELAPDHEPIGRITGFSDTPDKDIRVVLSPRN